MDRNLLQGPQRDGQAAVAYPSQVSSDEFAPPPAERAKFGASSSRAEQEDFVSPQPVQVNDSLFKLYKPHGPPSMQIILFHGLQEGNYLDAHLSTWQSGDGSCCWPQTWLVEEDEFPGAHVLSVCYSGGLKKRLDGSMDMFIMGENLLSDLLRENIGQEPYCPVILVGHSIGGLVIKELCNQAHDRLHSSEGDERVKLESFMKNLKGIFYYATPHHGSIIAEILGNEIQTPLVEYFRTLSTETERLNSKFEKICKIHKWHLAGLGENLSTNWNGCKHVFVPEASARGENFNIVETANHFTICRPKNKLSRSFNKLTEFLQKIDNPIKDTTVRHDLQSLPEEMVAIDVEVQKVIDKLHSSRKLCLTGMGGVGKTTLSRAVFNKMVPGFEYTCFLPNVKVFEGHVDTVKKEVWKQMYLCGEKVKGGDWFELRGKWLLLVLDDICLGDEEVLLDLAKLTAIESRFIVTSREQDVESADEIYEVSFLNKSNAKELFMKHAFPKLEVAPVELGPLVDDIVNKCDGLPLTLEVVGKYARRNKTYKYWEQTLNALILAEDVKHLDERLWAKLRLSYDGLGKIEQQMFLDTTTIFSGSKIWTLWEAKAAWRVAYGTKCDLLRWQTLVNMSLVYNVEENESIKVHEQLQSLGRKIASESNMGRLRVWDGGKGVELLCDAKDEQQVHPNALQLRTIRERDGGHDKGGEVHIVSAALHRLRKLRFLEVNVPVHVDGDEERDSFPTKLVLLKCVATKFDQVLLRPALGAHLVVLELSWENKLLLPNSIGCFSALKKFTICSNNLESIPEEFGCLSQLELLEFNCPNLPTLPESFGKLKALRHLVFLECSKLKRLPNSFGLLSKLNHLEFSNCHHLESLPTTFGMLSALSKLKFCCQELQTLPESLGNLFALTDLTFHNCANLHTLPKSLGKLSALINLRFDKCGNLHTLPESLGNLSNLTNLHISCRNLHTLPKSLGNLFALTSLHISCGNLHTLPEPLGNLFALTSLHISCGNLHTLPESLGNLSTLTNLHISCGNLHTLPKSLGDLPTLTSLHISCRNLHTLPESLGNLCTLTRLGLYNCENLHTLPKSLGNLFALTSLDISCGNLHTLPESLGNLFALTNFHISCENLYTLPESLGNLFALTNLDISCENLHTLPESLGNLSALARLCFYNCGNLDTLPESLGNLFALTRLRFYNCGNLHTLPESLGKLFALTSLDISCRNLHTLPESLGNLTALPKLKFLRCESLHTLPESLGNLFAMTDLSFHNCGNLYTLPESLGNLSALTNLTFHNCGNLYTLPESLGNLSTLIDLSFHDCENLHTMPESLGDLSALTDLSFHNCKNLHTLPESLGNLSALTNLVFDNCENLHTLPESLGNLSALTRLCILCGNLHTLPESLGNLSALTNLVFDNCENLHTLPESLGNLSALTELKFFNCKSLHTLPESLGNLSTLINLRFDQCTNLHTLPESLGKLSALTTLTFLGCERLHTLPESLRNLSALEKFNFFGSELWSLPLSCAQLYSFKSFCIEHSNLCALRFNCRGLVSEPITSFLLIKERIIREWFHGPRSETIVVQLD